MRASGCAALLAALLLGAPGPGAQERERFGLGVLRRDGVLLPFAAYGGSWSTTWPSSLHNVELPIGLGDVPEAWWGGAGPSGWTLWTLGLPRTSRPLAVTAPIVVPVGRERRLGLRTDYEAGEPPASPFALPYPKDGLAVTGGVAVGDIASVSRRSPAWNALPTRIRDEIEAAEKKAILRVQSGGGWKHPFPENVRRLLPAEIEAWYTSGMVQPGFGIAYIEAAKKYPPPPGDDCGLETFVSGWIHSNTRHDRLQTDLTARVTYCDRSGVSYMLPLGTVQAGLRTHWVFQLSSWETEWYAVLEVTPGRTKYVVEYFGGGRPSI